MDFTNSTLDNEGDFIDPTIVIGRQPLWAFVCGDIAPWATIVLRLSPIPTVLKFCRKGHVGSLPILPYTSLLSDSIFWIGFAILVKDTHIFVTHIACSAFALTYAIAYAVVYLKSNADKTDLSVLPGTVLHHILFVLTMIILMVSILIFPPRHVAHEVIGTCADIGSLMLYAGPLYATRAVMREKDASSLPLPYTSACFANATLWLIYGWFAIDEVYLWFPSLVGLLFAACQLALIATYGYKEENDRRKDSKGCELKDIGTNGSNGNEMNGSNGSFDDSDDGEFETLLLENDV